MHKVESTVMQVVNLEHLVRPLDSEALDLVLERHHSAAPILVADFSVHKTLHHPSVSRAQALALVTHPVLRYSADQSQPPQVCSEELQQRQVKLVTVSSVQVELPLVAVVVDLGVDQVEATSSDNRINRKTKRLVLVVVILEVSAPQLVEALAIPRLALVVCSVTTQQLRRHS